MSVEFWTSAERFYEFWFFIISLLLLLSAIVVIFIASYARKENRKSFILIMIAFVTTLGITGLLGHNRYRTYLEQASYNNPLIRDRQPRMATYIYYGTSEENYYSQLNYLDSLRNMVLYEEERVIEPVIYLGQGDYFHYFEDSNEQLFKQNRQVEFADKAEQAQLIGSRFTLKDKSFQEVGFKNPENTMFEYIEVPMSEQEKTYDPEGDSQIPRAEERIHHWNF